LGTLGTESSAQSAEVPNIEKELLKTFSQEKMEEIFLELFFSRDLKGILNLILKDVPEIIQ